MNTQARIIKLEREIKAASKAQTSAVDLRPKQINYRVGLSPEYPEPADTVIHIRHIDMTIQNKDGDE